MAGAGLAFVGLIFYSINVARRFVWVKRMLGAIALILATQVVCVLVLDLGDLLDLQYVALATAIAALFPQLAMLWHGLRNGPRPPRSGPGELLTGPSMSVSV